ncbi:SusC/RagA family TonB-linked outer membrane protein [Mucilaginibacter sp. HME9299]|uniref:SusC/RagA family TonB-linked outer membrane protein n=2 Tax=Mucilaginibacter aquatilis TaxID=1517760 RepID=A0A6I4IHN6_9SPHI|nr:SusC/RagA family TonB-linked outer membrane protein [Mucilaginibacter aquatilis]
MQYHLLTPTNCLKIMRITLSQLFIALILSTVAYAKSSNAQILDKIVSVTINEPNLESAIKALGEKTGVKFVYSKSIIQNNAKISYTATGQRLDAVLNNILPDQISYQLINDRIVLAKKQSVAAAETSVSTPVSAQQPPVQIKGKVTSDKGEELVGVSVTIKGSTTGTITDVNGNFSITVPDANTVLVVKYVGFTTQEVTVGTQTNLDIKLITQASNLSEVVVVGYNVVKRSDVTSSVVSINAQEIRSRPVANALEALQGKASGVDIRSAERPGTLGQVRIRGVRSITATSDPLYVVDGIPLNGSIENINPNDIENIDVLKDASATAVYGSRGANGVILVTTKRGKAGRLSLDYVGTATIETLHNAQEMMNSAQYIEFRRDAYRRVGYLNPAANANSTYPLTPTLADDRRIFGQDAVAFANIEKGWANGTFDGSLVPTTNWGDMVKKTGVTHDHILSASGGTDKMTAYGSFGYLRQDGTQVGQNYTRYSSKVSVDITPTKWFKMGASINATFSAQNYGFQTSNATGPGQLYSAALGMLPYAVPFDANGNRINLPGGDVNIQNPIGEEKYNIDLRKTTRALGSFYAELSILPGLKYRLQFGPDLSNYNNGRYQDALSINRGAGQAGSTNQAQLAQGNRMTWTLDHLLYYNKSVGKHDFGLTLLQSSQSNREESSAMTATKLPYTKQLWYQLNSVSALDAFSSNLVDSRLNSYMVRGNYTFDNKYILTAFVRWDGSSVLQPGMKWDSFPSVSAGWRLDQEDFIKQFSWIDALKVRVGVGTVGNAAVRPYTTIGALQTLYYTFGPNVSPGYVSSDASLANPISLPNPIGWEKTTQYNLGIEFGVLKNRINGAIDLYTTSTSDLLLNRGISPINGYPSAFDNIGRTSNRGIEITVNTVNVKTKDFTWTTGLNFSATREKIEELSLGKVNDVSNGWFIGQRVQTFYDYEKIGIWQDTEDDQREMLKYQQASSTPTRRVFYPGDIKIKDQNGDYRIDANNDRVFRGSRSPNWNGGMTNTFNYKGFELSAFVFARWGYIIDAGAESLQGRFAQRVLDYWTPTNPTNAYPSPNYNSAAGDVYRTSMNYQDGSFIKIRNISLGYFLPTKLTQKLNLSRVKVYAQALNPGYIHKSVDFIDPDTQSAIFNRGFVFGVNVGF